MQWTDERVELLKKLWADGLSASQIAAQLGGVTRNAVIGKVHRLKLSGRGRTTSASRPKKPSRPAAGGVQSGRSATRSSGSAGGMRPMTVSAGATALKADYDVDALAAYDRRPIEDIVVPISRRLSLIQLSEQTCKWPVGDPLSEDFHFCGTDTSKDGPYCSYHARLAYQPASERRRSR